MGMLSLRLYELKGMMGSACDEMTLAQQQFQLAAPNASMSVAAQPVYHVNCVKEALEI